jgi:zinc protease
MGMWLPIVPLLVIGVVGCVSVDAAGQVSSARKLLAAPLLKPQLPSPHEHRLTNGVIVLTLEDRRSPIVAVQIMIAGAGSYSDPEGVNGMAAAVLAALREGASQGTAATILQNSGAELSTNVAPGHAQITAIALKEHLTAVLDATARILTASTVPRAVFEKELTRARTRYAASFLATTGTRAAGPILADVLATTILSSQRKDGPDYSTASDFHRRHFRPSSVVVGISGDISADAARRLATNAFGHWKVATGPTRERAVARTLPQALLIPAGGAARVRFSVGARVPDPLSAPALDVLNHVYVARLRQRLRVEKGYAYDPSSVVAGTADHSIWSAYADVPAEVWGAALADLLAEIHQLATGRVPAHELQASKNALMAGLPVRMDTPSRALQLHAQRASIRLPPTYWNTYAAQIARVTSNDVRAVAKTHLSIDRLFVAAAGDAQVLDKALQKLRIPIRRHGADEKP